MKLQSNLFDRPTLYRCFHRILSGRKFRYIQRYLDNRRSAAPLKVIDFGCGPATNSFLFMDKRKYDYVGVDINQEYITWAQRHYDLNFICGDITKLKEMGGGYDLILINSVLHHLSDVEARRVLSASQAMLTPTGECVVLDMIRPQPATALNSFQRMMIRLDRGSFCRKLSELENLLESFYETQVAYSFDIRFARLRLWNLKLFVCRRPASIPGA